MSEELTRGRYRFADWTLSAVSVLDVISKCLTCGECSRATSSGPEVEMWSLKHAGMTHHTDFELTSAQVFKAAMVETAQDAPPT